MIKKCWQCVVVSCPFSFPIPYRNGFSWDDFRFCNRVLITIRHSLKQNIDIEFVKVAAMANLDIHVF